MVGVPERPDGADLRGEILTYAQAVLAQPWNVPTPPNCKLPFDRPDFDDVLSSISSELLTLLGHRHAQAFRGVLSDVAARGRRKGATKKGPHAHSATFYLVPIQGPALLLGKHLTFEEEYGVVSRASMRFWPAPLGGIDVLLPVIMTVRALNFASPHAIRRALDAARTTLPTEPGKGLDPSAVERVRAALGAESADALEARSLAKGQPWELVNRPELRLMVGVRFLTARAEAPWAVPPVAYDPTAVTPAEDLWRAWAGQRYAHVGIEMDPPRCWSSGCASAAARHAMLLINHRWRTRYGMTVAEVLRGGGLYLKGAGGNIEVTMRSTGRYGPVVTPTALAVMDPARFRKELYRVSDAISLEAEGVDLIGK